MKKEDIVRKLVALMDETGYQSLEIHSIGPDWTCCVHGIDAEGHCWDVDSKLIKKSAQGQP